MYNEQNLLIRPDKESEADIEKKMMFKPLANKQVEQPDELPLTEEEKAILAKFEQNDREIDEMLDQVIEQVQRLKFAAENINV